MRFISHYTATRKLIFVAYKVTRVGGWVYYACIKSIQAKCCKYRHVLATLITRMLPSLGELSYNTCGMLLRGYCLICLLRRMGLVARVLGKLPDKVLGASNLQRQYKQLICDTATISNKAYQHSCMNQLT